MSNPLSIGSYKLPPSQQIEEGKSKKTSQDIEIKALTKNFHLLNKLMDANGKIEASRVRVVTLRKNGQEVKLLKFNGLLRRWLNGGEKHRTSIESFINHEVEKAEKLEQFTPKLTIEASRYNQQICNASYSKLGKKDKSTVITLSSIKNTHVPDIAAKKFKSLEKQKPRLTVRNDKPEFIEQKRGLTKKKVRIYRGDTIDHQGKESFAIFKPTQIQRAKALFYRLAQKAGFSSDRLKQKLAKHDYYHGLKKSDYEPVIYAKDSPIVMEAAKKIDPEKPLEAPTSYWLGHATLLLGLKVRSEADAGKVSTLRVITDPVESDLAPILYPRMTKFAASMKKIPPPQVYLLSHNHFDHYSSKTIDKLLSQQPVIVVPAGDGYRYTEKGFLHVFELDWWESADIAFEQNGEMFKLKVNAVPARHWAGQGPCGGHESTFLGYVIEHEEGDIYFAGDTARLDDKATPHVSAPKEPELREQWKIQDLASLDKEIHALEQAIAKEKDTSDQEVLNHILNLKKITRELHQQAKDIKEAVKISKNPRQKELLTKRAAFLEKEVEIAKRYMETGEVPQISHVDALRELHNIKYCFQPGGPDEVREHMQSTHQASVDALWMHTRLMLHRIYRENMKLEDFLKQAGELKTIFMHTMAYKLGNLQLFDTPVSVSAVLGKLEEGYGQNIPFLEKRIEKELQIAAAEKYKMPKNPSDKKKKEIEAKRELYKKQERNGVILEVTGLKSYEWQVLCELVDFCKEMKFADNISLTPQQMAALLRETTIVPKIGSNIDLGKPKSTFNEKVVF